MGDDVAMLRGLYLVPPGSYNVNINRSWWRRWRRVEQGGWLTVERAEDGLVSVMWTTDKDSHWPYGEWGCAKSVSLKADGTLVSYFESAVTMWLKWGYGGGGDAELRKAMDFCAWAHQRLCQGAP